MRTISQTRLLETRPVYDVEQALKLYSVFVWLVVRFETFQNKFFTYQIDSRSYIGARQCPAENLIEKLPIPATLLVAKGLEDLDLAIFQTSGLHPKFNSLKKSLPLSSMMMKAGKSSTSMRQIASMPSSGYSTTSTFLMQCSARFAAAPPIEPR